MVRLAIFFFICGLCWPQEFIVITSSKTNLENLTSFQLRQIYLGKLDLLLGQRLTPVELNRDLEAAAAFKDYLFGTTFDLNNYWLTQKIKGDLKPPWKVSSPALMMALVERNPGFIGYLEQAALKDLKGFRLKTIKVEK